MVAAVLALLIVNRTGGRDEPGRAVSVEHLPAPAEGACLDSGPASQLWIETVCSAQHSAEVFGARRTPPPGPTEDRFEESGLYRGDFGTCDDIGIGRSVAEGDWGVRMPTLLASEVTVGGPVGWTGCVVTPLGGNGERTDYLGTVVAAEAAGDVPVSLRLCFAPGPADVPGPEGVVLLEGADPGPVVSCDSPHRWEVVGESQIWTPPDDDQLSEAPGTAMMAASCRTVAHQAVGSEEAFAGDRGLQLALDPEAGTDGSFTIPPVPEPAVAYSFMSLGSGRYCSVGAPAGWLLTESVVGVGGGPLPLERE